MISSYAGWWSLECRDGAEAASLLGHQSEGWMAIEGRDGLSIRAAIRHTHKHGVLVGAENGGGQRPPHVVAKVEGVGA